MKKHQHQSKDTCRQISRQVFIYIDLLLDLSTLINTDKKHFHRTHNPLVQGSSPCGPTNQIKGLPKGGPLSFLGLVFHVGTM